MPSTLPPPRASASASAVTSDSRLNKSISNSDQTQHFRTRKRLKSSIIPEGHNATNASTRLSHEDHTVQSLQRSSTRNNQQPTPGKPLSYNRETSHHLNIDRTLSRKRSYLLKATVKPDAFISNDSQKRCPIQNGSYKSGGSTTPTAEVNTTDSALTDAPQTGSSAASYRQNDVLETHSIARPTGVPVRLDRIEQHSRKGATEPAQEETISPSPKPLTELTDTVDIGKAFADSLLDRHGADPEALIQQLLVFSKTIRQHVRPGTKAPDNTTLCEYFSISGLFSGFY